MTLRAVLAALVLAGVLAPQSTWIVDATGGPGTHFKDLPPAVAAARPGDLILVRPIPWNAAYSDVTISKGLQIVGDGGRFRCFHVTLKRLPRGQRFALRDAACTYLYLLDGEGPIVVECVEARVVHIARCKAVSFQDAGTSFPGDLVVSHSTVAIRPGCPGPNPQPRSRVRFVSSVVTLHDYVATGERCACLGKVTCSSKPAITMDGGELFLTGRRTRISAGGYYFCASRPYAPAILVRNGGIVRYDPGVKLLAQPGGPPIAGGTAVVERLPGLTASLQLGALAVEVQAPAGSAVAILLGGPALATRTSFGLFWLDPKATLVLDTARVGAVGGVSWRWGVPANLWPGTPWALQGVVLHGSRLVTSSAAAVVVPR